VRTSPDRAENEEPLRDRQLESTRLGEWTRAPSPRVIDGSRHLAPIPEGEKPAIFPRSRTMFELDNLTTGEANAWLLLCCPVSEGLERRPPYCPLAVAVR
jgi:hypothetical protein